MRPYLRAANVFEDRIDISDVKEMNFAPGEFENFRLNCGDILLNEGQSLELVGRPAMFRDEVEDCCFQNTLVRFVPLSFLDGKYALKLFQHYMHNGRFQKIARWTTNIAHLGASRFADLEIPLPPLAEQKRIVLKIEELFSELDAGEESLRRARRQLGVYRQSLLKQAFEGKLTAPWRAQHPDLLESPDQLLARIQEELASVRHSRTRKATGNPKPEADGVSPSSEQLPTCWLILRLRELGTAITGNTPPTKDVANYGTEIPFVKPPDLTNHPVTTTGAYLSQQGGEKGRVLSQQSVLVTCIGNLGRTGINRIPVAFNQQINAVVPLSSVDANYLFYAAQSPEFRDQLEGMASATTIAIVNKGNFEQIKVPFCSLPEQQEIVRLLDAQFEVIEQNEREIDAALKRSEALRQSILRKAFTGHLVPQDPTDEPADALLARIRAEREMAANPARKRTPRKQNNHR